MKKHYLTAAIAAAMTLTMSVPAFAGQWLSDANGWWWKNDDGSYPANTWQWIDGNNDGTAECYYFNEGGYCLMNTTTPDNYTVNPAGAWIVNGVVQTQPVAISVPNTEANQQVVNGVNSNRTEGQEKPTDMLDLWRVRPTITSGLWSSKREECEGENGIIYKKAWELQVEPVFGGDVAIVFENEGYDYMTFTYAPGKDMEKTSIPTFLVKGGEDAESRDWKDADELFAEDFMYDTEENTITVDISGYEAVLIGIRDHDTDGCMIVSNMYFHN